MLLLSPGVRAALALPEELTRTEGKDIMGSVVHWTHGVLGEEKPELHIISKGHQYG